jgi:hypothetical protein
MTFITKVIKMHAQDRFSWFLLPWIILFTSFIINLLISFFIDDPVYTGGISSIFVCMFVAGIIISAQTFPFAIGFSIRRSDYFLGTTGFSILNGLVHSLLLLIFSLVETQTNAWSSDLHFFRLPYLSDGGAGIQFWINFNLFMFVFLSGFLINCLYRRLGRIGLLFFFLAVSVVFTVGGYVFTSYNVWPSIFDWLKEQSAFDLSLWMFPVNVIIALISYILLRKATV